MARLIALALGATAASALTQEEAQCIASFDGGQTFVMSGDSNMRYEFLALNEYIEKGTVMSSLSRNGDKNKGQIDDGGLSFWTDVPIPQYDPLRTKDGSHMRRMDKKYKTGGSSSFFFLQKTWQDFFADSKGPKRACEGARNCVMIYNVAWWDLKDWPNEKDHGYCGEDMDDGCKDWYGAMVTTAMEAMCEETGATACVWRSAPCCGDWVDPRPDGKNVEVFNEVAKKALPGGVEYVEVFDLYGRDELEENTFDTQHATGENYLEWNDRVMRSVDCQLGSKCIADNKCDGPAPAPRPAPDDDQDDEPAPAPAPRPDDDGGSCADIGEKCKEEGDCCEAPPRSCYLFKGKDKGKCFEECPDDKKYACYEDGPAPVPRYSPTKKPTKPSGGGGGRYMPTYKPTRGSD